MPLYDHQGELHHISIKDEKYVINNLKNQYKTEHELLALMNLIMTLERLGLI